MGFCEYIKKKKEKNIYNCKILRFIIVWKIIQLYMYENELMARLLH